MSNFNASGTPGGSLLLKGGTGMGIHNGMRKSCNKMAPRTDSKYQ